MFKYLYYLLGSSKTFSKLIYVKNKEWIYSGSLLNNLLKCALIFMDKE